MHGLGKEAWEEADIWWSSRVDRKGRKGRCVFCDGPTATATAPICPDCLADLMAKQAACLAVEAAESEQDRLEAHADDRSEIECDDQGNLRVILVTSLRLEEAARHEDHLAEQEQARRPL